VGAISDRPAIEDILLVSNDQKMSKLPTHLSGHEATRYFIHSFKKGKILILDRILWKSNGIWAIFSYFERSRPISMELNLVLGISLFGLLFALFLIRDVMKRDTGTPQMREISDAIKAGAQAFLRRQNRTIAYLAVALACLIYILYAFVRTHNQHDPASPGDLALWTTLSFVLGAACSVAAGYMGMWVAIRANIRTAAGATRSMNDALQAALRGGAVSGFFVVAMSLLGVGGLFAIVKSLGVTNDVTKIPLLIVGYGFGASFVALFAQLGGGIYTKAADVGADLVGKVEAGIPEDDPRNPAVIADLVGDNVGDW
jgi:Na+/H+-translocating membrane pyrophosphatase